jgi:ATP-dependent Lon protease
MLQGLARVRFTGFPQSGPFRIAEIERMIEVPAPPAKAEALMVEVRELCARFRQAGHELPENFESLLETVTDPAKLTDAVSHAFVSDSLARQMLLELDNVELRLRALAATLRVELQT